MEGNNDATPISGGLQGLSSPNDILPSAANSRMVVAQLHKVGTAAMVERITRAGVTTPELIINFAVDATNLPSLRENLTSMVVGDLPPGGVLCELLSLRGGFFLTCDGVLTAFCPVVSDFFLCDVGGGDDLREAFIQRIDIVKDRGGGKVLTQFNCIVKSGLCPPWVGGYTRLQ